MFEKLPSETDIEEVAIAYKKAIKEAVQMGRLDKSPEQFMTQIRALTHFTLQQGICTPDLVKSWIPANPWNDQDGKCDRC